ncbi:MAG: hypothetical protein J6M18_00700, partial [Actinomycetaceae bacterium]|nr:hypothetical protein [Actinomycetaceae bacterium]
LAIDDDVRSAVNALATAGVRVYVASIIDSGSKVLVSLDQVKPPASQFSRFLKDGARMRVEGSDDSQSHPHQPSVYVEDVVTTGQIRPIVAQPAVVVNDSSDSSDELDKKTEKPSSSPHQRPRPQSVKRPQQASAAQAEEAAQKRSQANGKKKTPVKKAIVSASIDEKPAVNKEVSANSWFTPVSQEKSEQNMQVRADGLVGAVTEQQTPSPDSAPTPDVTSKKETTPVDTSHMTLGNFDVVSRPPVSSDDDSLPVTRAAASALSTTSALSAPSPSLAADVTNDVSPQRISRRKQAQGKVDRSPVPHVSSRSEVKRLSDIGDHDPLSAPLAGVPPVSVNNANNEHSVETSPQKTSGTRQERDLVDESLRMLFHDDASSSSSARSRRDKVRQDIRQHQEDRQENRRQRSRRARAHAMNSSVNNGKPVQPVQSSVPAQGRLLSIAKRYETPLPLHWIARRKGIDLRAQIMPWGTIVLANGTAYSDPTEAAVEESGLQSVDGWLVWKTEDGRSLGDL